jgi:hypothetical protein
MAAAVALLPGCAAPSRNPVPPQVLPDNLEACLETIRNDRVVVGILPQVGGGIMLCRLADRRNVLLADPRQWAEPESERPVPDAVGLSRKDYQGHVVWLGPQSRWWTEQDLNPAKRAAASLWPPDPWLIHGRYEVVERTAGSIVLRGPDSPISGIRLTKSVRILPDDRIEVAVTAENIRQAPVTWGLWSNTRLPGTCQAYATYCDKTWNALRLEYTGQPRTVRIMPYCVANNVFSFSVDRILSDRQFGYVAKASLKPEGERLVIAAFTPDTLFLKNAAVTADAVSPGHAPIEIFQQLPADKQPGSGLLELEFHGPQRTLQTGETMTFVETWILIPWQDGLDPERQVKALRELRPEDFEPM